MWNGVLCALLAGAMWGGVFIVPEILAAFTPLELAVGRYVSYGLIAMCLMLPRLGSVLGRVSRADGVALLRHALAGNIVYYMLLAIGVKLAGVAATSLIIGLMPITVTLMGHKDHGAMPLARLAPALLVVGAGMLCINVDVFLHARASGGDLLQTLLGIVCATAALACWTWYSVDNARYLKRHAHFSSAEWSALYGITSGMIAIVAGALAFFIWHADITGAAGNASGRDWTLFWSVNAALALGASVIANQLWNIASRRVPVTLGGQLILFETLFALLYGCLYTQTPPRALEVAAFVLLIIGVAWSVRLHAQAEITPA